MHRQLLSRYGHTTHHHQHVHHRLQQKANGEPYGKQPSECIWTFDNDLDRPEKQEEIKKNNKASSNQSIFLNDDGVNHIRIRMRQKISLVAVAGTITEEAAL